jgi:hypothetical protein
MKVIILSIIVIFLFISCDGILNSSDPKIVVIKSDHFDLAWDAPSSDIEHTVFEVKTYRIYYRIHGRGGWTLMDEIDAVNKPKYTISYENLEYGVYDFAVSAVNSKGIESDLNESTDYSAQPRCGWFINWLGP